MITLKKSELELTLLTIAAFETETGKMISGLLTEELNLGTKRKLQKIHKPVQEAYKEFIQDFKELEKVCGEDKEKLKSEVEILLAEEVKIDAETISMASIENISTKLNYNFDIIEKIAS